MKNLEKYFDEFFEIYKNVSFIEFEELISNTKNEEKKLFFNMLLQYSMDKNFKKILDEEKY